MARLQKLAMHMDQAETRFGRQGGMRPVVQVVDILGDQQKVAVPHRSQLRQGVVRRIWHHLGHLAAALVVEILDQSRIGGETFRRRDLFNAVAAPQAVRGAEGRDARFGGNTGAGQDDDVAYHVAAWAGLPSTRTSPSRRGSAPPS